MARWVIMHLPLSATALSPDECWNLNRFAPCRCGVLQKLFDKRCMRCRLRNPTYKLYRRRRHLERWVDRRVQPVGLKLEGANRLLANARQLDDRFADILSRPFPVRQRQENLNLFLRRSMSFLENLLKTTSPARLARELDAEIRRTAELFTSISVQEVMAFVSEALGQAAPPPSPETVANQAQQVQRELSGQATAYVKALQTLQNFHGRLVEAFRAARPILSRDHKESGVRALWNRARGAIKPTGKLINFGTAVWRDDAERETLDRLDAELHHFRNQLEQVRKQYKMLEATEAAALQAQVLSLRKYIVFALTSELGKAEPAKRAELVVRLLSLKGVGGFWWRLWKGGA